MAAASLVLTCSLLVPQALAQTLPAEKLRGLPAFVDAAIPRVMEQGHVVGAAVAIVHDGQIMLERAYGRSELLR